MNIEDVRDYYLRLPFISESFPFGEDILVFKVGSKMFGLAWLGSGEACINLKCDPDRAIELREHYDAVEPGYHMNKVHWNTIYLDRDLGRESICQLIQHSYELVYQSLSKREKASLHSNT